MELILEIVMWILAVFFGGGIFAYIIGSLTVMEYVREGREVSYFTVPWSILSPDSVEPEGKPYRKVCLYGIASAFGAGFMMIVVVVFATKVIGLGF